MGIAGSQILPDFFEDYLGMRVESVDEVEVLRRIDKEIYDKELYEKALAWVKENCPEGLDKNPDFIKKSAEEKQKDWEQEQLEKFNCRAITHECGFIFLEFEFPNLSTQFRELNSPFKEVILRGHMLIPFMLIVAYMIWGLLFYNCLLKSTLSLKYS